MEPTKIDNSQTDNLHAHNTTEIIFCQAIMNGETQAQAYTKAFPEKAAKYSKNTLTTEAFNFLNTKKIKNLLLDMRRELQREATMHFLDKIEILQDFINDPNINVKDRLRAIDTHNKMTGDFAATKVENSGNLTVAVDPKLSEALDKLFN